MCQKLRLVKRPFRSRPRQYEGFWVKRQDVILFAIWFACDISESTSSCLLIDCCIKHKCHLIIFFFISPLSLPCYETMALLHSVNVFRPVVPECAGCAMAHPDFCRSVNLISTRGDRLCPPHYYWHTRNFWPSDGPVKYVHTDCSM